MGTLTVKLGNDDGFGRNLPDDEVMFHDVEGYEFTETEAHSPQFFVVKKNDGSIHAVRSYKVMSFIFTKE